MHVIQELNYVDIILFLKLKVKEYISEPLIMQCRIKTVTI